MKRLIAFLLAFVVIAAACGVRGNDGVADEGETPASTGGEPSPESTGEPSETSLSDESAAETTTVTGEMWGDLPSPCGDGDATIAEGQNGGDTLKLGTATDHGAAVAAGLNVQMLDAGQAFAKWCNAQGGIAGLEIEVVDLDAKLFEPVPMIAQACEEVFAMVGGGVTLDDLTFPAFHECGMIDIAGFTVTASKADSNGFIQPIPNPPYTKTTTWMQWVAETHPDAIAKTGLVFGDIPTTQLQADSMVKTMEALDLGFEIVAEVEYPAAGPDNWTPFAQQIVDADVQSLSFVGATTTLAPLLKALDQLGHTPEVMWMEANHLNNELILLAGDAAEGVVARTPNQPFEEADRNPATRLYIDNLAASDPSAEPASLGVQTTSAYLMFGQAANDCLAANDNVLERECVLEAAYTIDAWTGGGLHSPTRPAENLPADCTVLMQVQDGAWTRIYPEIGSADDNTDGFNCRGEDGLVEIEGDYGSGAISPNRTPSPWVG